MSKSGIPIVSDVGKLGGQIVKPLAPILKTVAPILPFLPIPGLGPLSALATRSLLTGIASGLDKSGNFNFNRGLKAGALAYGVGSLMNTANANGNPLTSTEGVSEGVGYGDVPSSGAAGSDFSGGSIPATVPVTSSGLSAPSVAVPAGQMAPITGMENTANLNTSTEQFMANRAADSTSAGLANLASAAGDTILNAAGSAGSALIKDPINTALAGTTLYGTVKSKQELDAQKAEAERILSDQANQKAEQVAWAQGVLRDYPINYRRLTAEDVVAQRAASGGLMGLAGGGRFLQGPGDGTSDSIAARIGGQQEARLADGEFVVDARTVSELGNGSSKAGAKKLYAMMDRVHAARRGAQRGKPSGADKYMPA